MGSTVEAETGPIQDRRGYADPAKMTAKSRVNPLVEVELEITKLSGNRHQTRTDRRGCAGWCGTVVGRTGGGHRVSVPSLLYLCVWASLPAQNSGPWLSGVEDN